VRLSPKFRDYNATMNWMQLALQLTRAAMSIGDEPQRQPETPTNLGEALAQQFALIDRSIETLAHMVNSQNQRLERQLKRQKIWNYALTAGLVIAIAAALIRL
jgi:hypothetical protein